VSAAVDTDRLHAVARWDAAEVRRALGVLAAVGERLGPWRLRVEQVGRRIEDGQAWSGAAAAVAGRAVLTLSGATAAVAAAVDGAVGSCRTVAADAGAAAASARSSLVAGPGAGEHLAAAGLRHADAVAAALHAAGEALADVGVRDAFTPDLDDLADRTAGAALPPLLPAAATPSQVAAWWAGLGAPAQRGLVQQRAAAIGALDGVPAWARNRANRLLLARALHRAEPSPTAAAVAAVLATHEAAGERLQLHLFDEAGERVALGLGDTDTADAVALLVPGIGTSPVDDLGSMTAQLAGILSAARQAGAAAPAGVAWLGYRPPGGVGILGRGRAEQAGPVLDRALDGLAAARRAEGRPAARTTVVAHSYGTVVLDEAADAPGRLAADAVVLLGSPGMERTGAAGLEAREVHVASTARDPISWSGWFGASPWADSFGARELPVGPGTGHSDYLDAGRPTLPAIGAVVGGGRR
jgi:hypothetical protein